MNPRSPAIAERAAHRCEYCRAPEAGFNLRFEVEHIVPRCCGGGEDNLNLALSCRACNLHKSVHTHLDANEEKPIPLFHPRDQSWEEHFTVSTASGEIEGVTEIGRATVLQLQMNTPLQLKARKVWMKLGLYP